MDNNRLALLNEAVQSEAGQRLLAYMQEVMVETAAAGKSNAEWVKGMGMLISCVKGIGQEFEKERNKGRN